MPLVNRELTHPLTQLLMTVADDAWMMGQAGLSWVGQAPTSDEGLLEATLSQIYLRHAYQLYAFVTAMRAPVPSPPGYSRPLDRWRHAGLLGEPSPHWAEWLIRSYCFEVFDSIRRQALRHIAFAPLVALWDAIEAERHGYSQRLFIRLFHWGQQDQRARDDLQAALTQDWPFLADFSEWGTPDTAWAAWDVAEMRPSALRQQFLHQITPQLTQVGLVIPRDLPPPGRRARHHTFPDDAAFPIHRSLAQA
ncbi:MAG: phenylacetate-CoA oxygenase subunit PaaI [Firmicutes bacterium]|nr:phenylacetate-CoA oxygenase subunit PaaI [Bacillota bacterium]